MRHGFSYLQFLAVAALLVLIVAAVNPLVFNILKKSFQKKLGTIDSENL